MKSIYLIILLNLICIVLSKAQNHNVEFGYHYTYFDTPVSIPNDYRPLASAPSLSYRYSTNKIVLSTKISWINDIVYPLPASTFQPPYITDTILNIRRDYWLFSLPIGYSILNKKQHELNITLNPLYRIGQVYYNLGCGQHSGGFLECRDYYMEINNFGLGGGLKYSYYPFPEIPIYIGVNADYTGYFVNNQVPIKKDAETMSLAFGAHLGWRFGKKKE
jgi:hypothetical protein